MRAPKQGDTNHIKNREVPQTKKFKGQNLLPPGKSDF